MTSTIQIAVYYFGQVLIWLIFARAIMSWFIRDYNNPIMALAIALTEPILGPVRKLLSNFNFGGTMIDFSPLVAMLLIQLVIAFVINLL